jgi:hypothetical protein
MAQWASKNKIFVLPGQAKTKKPMGFLARGALAVPEGMNPEDDSYHVTTPQRIEAVRNFWRTVEQNLDERYLSVACDTEYPEIDKSTQRIEYLDDEDPDAPGIVVAEAGLKSEVNVAVLDLDSDEYYDRFINHPLIADWPVVAGERGCKAYVKVNYSSVPEKPKNMAYLNPATNDAVLEILTTKKLAFIYGEHPNSTPEHPILYHFVRGFDLERETLKTIPYAEFVRIYEAIANDLDLTKREYTQRALSQVSPIEYLRREQRKARNRESGHSRQSLTDLLGLRIEDVGFPDGHIAYAGQEIIGSHPIHGSGGGQNYHINPSKNVWRCYSTPCGGGMGTGGDPLIFLAMRYGLIECSECHEGVLDDARLMRELVTRMRADGYEIPEREREPRDVTPIEVPESITRIPTLSDREDLPSIDEFADGPPYIHLSASPRKGKTHRLIEYLMYGVSNGTYVTHTHATCGQAFRIAVGMAEDLRSNNVYRTVLWLAGKGKCCSNDTYNGIRTPCKDCPLYPGEERIPMGRYEWMAEHMINTELVLSPEIIKSATQSYCPYYILKIAEQYADVVITVPHFLTTRDKESRIRPRDTIVIDEDTTISSFYPGSIELASMVNTASQMHFDHNMNNIKDRVDSLKRVATTNDAGEPKKRLTAEDKVIIKVSGIVDQIHDRLNRIMDNPLDNDPIRAFDDLSFVIVLKNGTPPISEELKLSTIDKVEKYEHEVSGRIDEDNSVSELFEMILFHCDYAGNPPLWWQGAGSTKRKLFLIGDHEHLIREIGMEPETRQIIAIGFTHAEKFIEDMQQRKPGESVKYDIKKFGYGKNFTLVKVCASPDDAVTLRDGATRTDYRRSAKKRFYNLLNHAAHINKNMERASVPSIVLTSSQARQDKLVKSHNEDFYPLKKERLSRINRFKFMGSFLAVVSNSTFTRGIDVDMYDVMWSESTDYAQPYCDAMFEWAFQESDNVTMSRISKLKMSYIIDEITNCVLRISPIRGRDEEQSKIIIMPDYDAEKIHPKVIEDMHVIEFNDDTKMDTLWNIISTCSRKTNITTEELSMLPGLSYPDAREEFDHFIASGPEEGRLIASARRDRHGKIDKYIITSLKNTKKRSRASIIKYVIDNTKIKKMKHSEIESRLNYLSVIGRVSSQADPTKNVIYYRYIPTDADIPNTSGLAF